MGRTPGRVNQRPQGKKEEEQNRSAIQPEREKTKNKNESWNPCRRPETEDRLTKKRVARCVFTRVPFHGQGSDDFRALLRALSLNLAPGFPKGKNPRERKGGDLFEVQPKCVLFYYYFFRGQKRNAVSCNTMAQIGDPQMAIGLCCECLHFHVSKQACEPNCQHV